MRPLLPVIAVAVLGFALATASASATPGGGPWMPAQQSDQVAMVTELNADLSAHDGKQHAAGCFSMSQLRGHHDLVAVTIRPLASVGGCGTAKDFGVLVLREVDSHWTILASATGAAGGSCTYYAKASPKIKALLAKAGPCYSS